ncbi:MAG: ATP-binding protein, partial [Candidatus Hodarchaeota archaeon]
QTVTLINKKGCEILGYEEDEILGKNWFENFLPERVRKEVKSVFDRLMTGEIEPVEYFENQVLTKKGEERIIAWHNTFIRDETGNNIKTLSSGEDITNRVKAQESEIFLHELLRHDVKNKCVTTQGYLELLEETKLVEEQIKLLEGAMKINASAVNLISKIRYLRTIEQGLDISRTDLKAFLEEVTNNYREKTVEKGIELSLKSAEVQVQGGPLLKELFSNVIENAIQHSNCTKIQISVQTDKNSVLIAIEDNGRGVPTEIKNTLFDKGVKGADSHGSGLGLYLVKKIVENYNGLIEAKDSRLGGLKLNIRLVKG